MVSNLACEQFVQHLASGQSYVNFGFGTLTTVLAGAGAIVTGATAARILSGLAGVSSGIDSEYNKDYIKNNAAAVIMKAAKSWRVRYLTKIQTNQTKIHAQYPVEAAVSDGLTYNGGCSLVNGLNELATRLDPWQQVPLQRPLAMTQREPWEQRL